MKSKKAPPGLAMRQQAAERLAGVLRGANFAPFSLSEIPDGRDRATANRLVTTALRRHGHLDLALARYLERGMPKRSGPFEAHLRLALAQLLYLPELGAHSALFLAVEALRGDNRTQHLAKLANAVLRRAQADAEDLRALPLPALFPERLRAAWQSAYGEAALGGMAEALLQGAPLDLTLPGGDPTLIAALGAGPVLFDTVRILERDRSVEALPGYAEGRWWVQDAAAALPARLLGLEAPATVLDLCAAPGGKSAQLAAAGHRVTALDSDPERMARLTGNLDRLGLAAIPVVADALAFTPTESYDGIVLDAPCSATGTFRRHPEVVWHRDAAAIASRVAVQRGLIERSVSWLKSGGVLIYCVCSLEPAEGEEQAKWLAEHTGLAPDPIGKSELPGLETAVTAAGYVRTLPGMPAPGPHGGTLDGFFIARFRRR